MATAVRSRRQYATYGNVAYRNGYDSSAVRVPGQEEVLTPRSRPRKKVLARPKVRVREAGEVSIFGVVGFIAVLVLSLFLIFSYSQLTDVNNQTVHLKTNLVDLQETEATLLAQQQMAYDLQDIEKQVTENGSMSKPKSSQQVMLDISEADNVILYKKEDSSVISIFNNFRENAGSLFTNVLSYFN